MFFYRNNFGTNTLLTSKSGVCQYTWLRTQIEFVAGAATKILCAVCNILVILQTAHFFIFHFFLFSELFKSLSLLIIGISKVKKIKQHELKHVGKTLRSNDYTGTKHGEKISHSAKYSLPTYSD